MKKKYLCIILLALAVSLLCLSLILTAKWAMGKSMIGGAGIPTLIFVFFHQSGGVCFYLALASFFCTAASLIIRFAKK